MKLRINIKIKVNSFNLYIYKFCRYLLLLIYWYTYFVYTNSTFKYAISRIYDKKYHLNEMKLLVNTFKMTK